MSVGLVTLALSTKGKLMEDDYGWGDISEDYFFEEEEYSPEELAAQDRAERQQALQEAYAEFLDAPNCFDWGSLGGAPPGLNPITEGIKKLPNKCLRLLLKCNYKKGRLCETQWTSM